MKIKTYDVLREGVIRFMKENDLESGEVIIQATPLSPDEAIGKPEDEDYLLLTSKERLMQAEFRGSLGPAFTDMYGDFSARLSDIVAMDLRNNFQRAIFISSLNAVMRYLGLIDKTVHCYEYW